MGDAKKHVGGCHCGKVRFEATFELGKVMECNCSICSKKGWLLAPVPAENFKVTSGEDALTEYKFNKHVVRHSFCKHCGISGFAQGKGPGGKDMAMINARCLDGVDVSQLTVTMYDGKSS